MSEISKAHCVTKIVSGGDNFAPLIKSLTPCSQLLADDLIAKKTQENWEVIARMLEHVYKEEFNPNFHGIGTLLSVTTYLKVIGLMDLAQLAAQGRYSPLYC